MKIMGMFMSKLCHNNSKKKKQYENPVKLRSRIQVLEGEMAKLKYLREQENMEHEEKEKEWRREKKKSKEDEIRFRKKIKEDEERIKGLQWKVEMKNIEEDLECYSVEVEQLKEEQAQREIAVERWKNLYLSIKCELDDLIHRTTQGTLLVGGGGEEEEDLVDRLQRELLVKEEMVEEMKSRLVLMDKEMAQKDRKIDILRQSLKILSNSNTRSYNVKNN